MNKTKNAPDAKWYDRYIKKDSPKHAAAAKAAGKKSSTARQGPQDRNARPAPAQASSKPDARLISVTSMFEQDAVPEDARKTLADFLSIIQGVFPSNSRQLLSLPDDIRRLSHELTDERNDRRVGYMNTPAYLSAYLRYFSWWNLIRLTRLFANLGAQAFNLKDDACCLDAGSGPLTVVTALWLACPELRNLKLTWYCMDISQNALSVGEDIYLSAASRTPPKNPAAAPHWKIIRVKGALGTEIKQKVSLVTCANMFNELYQDGQYAPEMLAAKYASTLLSYAAPCASVLVIEPGVPRQARIISLLRDSFIEKGMSVPAPCPHASACAMNGLHARMGGTAKWCNFAFSTEDAPAQLQKLSADAGIPKERAVLSFVLATSAGKNENDASGDSVIKLRIASDPIRLPGHRTGYYACSRLGLTLVVDGALHGFKSGDIVVAAALQNLTNLSKDYKTGALVLVIGSSPIHTF